MTNQPDEMDEGGDDIGVERINRKILDKLNQFEATTRRKETCLGCGYVGIMGIEDEIQPWWLTWPSIILITIVGSLFMGAGLVIGVLLVVARYFGSFDSMVLVCPSCEEQYVEG